jgi:hypothetical protein
MVSTHNDYKISGEELLLGLEQSRASIMSQELYEEEEYPRDRLDRFEQSLATLTSMVSELLVVKSKETKTFHEGPNPKKEKKKPETEHNTEPKIGECNYNKKHVPFCVQAKVYIKTYAREVDVIGLNQWLQ